MCIDEYGVLKDDHRLFDIFLVFKIPNRFNIARFVSIPQDIHSKNEYSDDNVRNESKNHKDVICNLIE